MLGHRKFIMPVVDNRLLGDLPRRVVSELIARNWDAPGVTVRFHYFGTGNTKSVSVASIATQYARIDFTVDGRVIGVSGGRRQLDIWWGPEGFSSIHLQAYTGENWAEDAADFMSGRHKFAARPGDEPRNYATYDGGCYCDDVNGAIFSSLTPLVSIVLGRPNPFRGVTHVHRDAVPPLLVLAGSEGAEVQYCHTSDVLKERQRWLEHTMLAPIRGYLLPEQVIDIFDERLVPFPSGLGPFFAFGSIHDATRWHTGHFAPEALEPKERFGLSNLNHFGFSHLYRDPELPVDLWHGAITCGFGRISPSESLFDLTIPGRQLSDWDTHVFLIQPVYANGIFVADRSVYGDPETESYADEDARYSAILEADRRVARTIVPVTEYNGSYEQPVLLIGRELALYEIADVSGPWVKPRAAARRRRRWWSLAA